MKKLFFTAIVALALAAASCRSPVYVYDPITDCLYPREVYEEMYPETTATVTITIM